MLMKRNRDREQKAAKLKLIKEKLEDIDSQAVKNSQISKQSQ